MTGAVGSLVLLDPVPSLFILFPVFLSFDDFFVPSTEEAHLPQQHSQQQKNEDPHQQTDGDDPAHDVATGFQVVQGLEDHLGGTARVRA